MGKYRHYEKGSVGGTFRRSDPTTIDYPDITSISQNLDIDLSVRLLLKVISVLCSQVVFKMATTADKVSGFTVLAFCSELMDIRTDQGHRG